MKKCQTSLAIKHIFKLLFIGNKLYFYACAVENINCGSKWKHSENKQLKNEYFIIAEILFK